MGLRQAGAFACADGLNVSTDRLTCHFELTKPTTKSWPSLLLPKMSQELRGGYRQARNRQTCFSWWQCWLLLAYSKLALLLGTVSLVVCPLTTEQLNMRPLRHPTGTNIQMLEALLTDAWSEQRHSASLPLAFSPAELLLRSSELHFEQLIYLLGNNCSLLALNEPLSLAETWECNMSFAKLSRESTGRLQKYALYSVRLNE